MKVVINTCFGGFSLSPLATKRLAELQEKKCYFFKLGFTDERYTPLTLKETEDTLMWTAYSVPNPQDYRLNEEDEDGLFKGANERAKEISIDRYERERHHHFLVQVVEELGEKASGKFAQLKVVEIPNGVEYTIEEYDGSEHIAEAHRTWS